jgi:coenzyme F420-reducing hydrogenase delta subunit/quinol-cytochrome oxidoreductase complex cytochrome b subunit
MRDTLRRGLQRVEAGFDAAFGARANPWRHLGAIAFWLFWIVAATGAWVYAAFDTSVTGAYASVESMTGDQWPLGGVARSLHRYASDAFALVVLLHLAREWLNGHAKGFRWFSWVSGVPLLWLAYACGLGGYWLVFDRLAQFSLVATTEWLDALPLFGGALARNFIANGVTNRLFSLLIFLHIGIPLCLLAGMWIHIERIGRPRTAPPRRIAAGTAFALIALSFALPARSDAPADLSQVASTLNLDWFYQGIHPLHYATSPAFAWALTVGFTLVLLVLPWMPRARRPAPARVDLANCNGCGRCFADCPYVAVTMRPRSDGRPLAREAVVDPDLCAACGICAGACPSSTPFRSVEALATGIDLPQRPIDALRTALEQALAGLRGTPSIVAFGCDCAAPLAPSRGADTAALSLACSAMLPPAFVEYALRNGADGVLVTGCRDGDCAYRLGNRWAEERLAAQREPHLRPSVPRLRVRLAWHGPYDGAALARTLAEFRADLRSLGANRAAAPKRASGTRPSAAEDRPDARPNAT